MVYDGTVRDLDPFAMRLMAFATDTPARFPSHFGG